MLRTALVAVLMGALLSGCGIRIVKYEFSDDQTVAEKFTSVRVRAGFEQVSIRYVPGLSETKIHRKVQHAKNNKPSGVSHRVEGSSLVLDDCGDHCSIEYQVQLPSADIAVVGEDVRSGDATIEGVASVDYRNGSGRVVVRDIAGDVRVDSGSGDFDATNVRGSVTATLSSGRIRLDQLKSKALVHTGSGDITGTRLDGDVTADASSGDVALTFASQRSVRVDTSSGNVTVRVPGGPYKVDVASGSDEQTISVPTDPAAPVAVHVSTGSGHVRVLGG
ncbi:DUF4097 family beta strand repeat-containing protein [Lentzea sp. NPDC004782]|uniref:DUF4097 family beta strand repeat-containing protein n=1 Tax=Lentzea sp. NPDC004782 TaxID=3154458 RepID=UPI0033B3C989